MPSISEMPYDEDGQRQYRRGYAHGAHAVLNAIEQLLAPNVTACLRLWATKDLLKWQTLGSGQSEFLPPILPDLHKSDQAT